MRTIGERRVSRPSKDVFGPFALGLAIILSFISRSRIIPELDLFFIAFCALDVSALRHGLMVYQAGDVFGYKQAKAIQ
jgi:hypothetical protein